MTPHYYYDSKANTFYGPLDRMPPDKTLESIVDDIEAFSIYEPLWNAFHTYLSTLHSIPHTFSGHSRVVPEGEIEWRYEVAWRNPDGTITGWKECEDMFHYEQQPYQYRRRVATPKITEGKCHVCGKEGGGHYINCTEHFKALTAQPDKPGEGYGIYRVIADYPDSPFKIGQVIDIAKEYPKDRFDWANDWYAKYPNIFKPLFTSNK